MSGSRGFARGVDSFPSVKLPAWLPVPDCLAGFVVVGLSILYDVFTYIGSLAFVLLRANALANMTLHSPLEI